MRSDFIFRKGVIELTENNVRNSNNNAHFERNRRLVEAALLVAIATVLSMIKIAELPYGGSITLASMLPIVLIAYRNGPAWGLCSGLVYGLIQQLLGLKNLSYFTAWYSILAIILLDYLVAFAVMGLGGVFRKTFRRQSSALMVGSLLGCFLRYLCHVISGATVWAGLSIPTQAALGYSFVYNATYMLPETIILVIIAYYIGSLIDFRKERPTRLDPAESAISAKADIVTVLAGVAIVGALIYDIAAVFRHLQNAESGEFDVRGLSVSGPFVKSFWLSVIVVTGVAVALACVLLLVRKYAMGSAAKEADPQEKTEG